MATLFRLPLVRRLGCSVGGQHCIQYPVSIAGVQRQFFATSALARQSEKSKGQIFETQHTQPPGLVEIDFEVLKSLSPEAMKLLREAFVGKKAYGAIAVRNIPNYGELRNRAFRHGIDLALKDSEGREKAAAVNNTYPGWSGVPGQETHPLQSSFLFNVTRRSQVASQIHTSARTFFRARITVKRSEAWQRRCMMRPCRFFAGATKF